MFVLSLCRQLCPDKLPVQIGDRLGDGADGEVLSIVNDSNKVIKLGIFYERHDKGLLKPYQQIRNTLYYLMEANLPCYAKVYEQGYLCTSSRKAEHWRTGTQHFILYYYIMEKLQKISEDEKKVFHSILSHEDRGIAKNYSVEKIKEMLQGMSRALDFDMEKVIIFCKQIAEAPVSHLDIHVRNIMKDSNNNFKLIDLDRIELETDNGEE